MYKVLNQKPLNLNLGCGSRERIPGFVNIDIVRNKNVDIASDIRRLPMVHTNSVDLIYASHLISYFDNEEIKYVLKEWRRVLKIGGVLRLATPDFEKIAQLYNISKFKLDDFIGPLYGRLPIGHNKFIYHKNIYDFKTLEALLNEQGFNFVKRYDWRKTIHKDYDDWSQSYLPHMDKKNGVLMSLNLECVKI